MTQTNIEIFDRCVASVLCELYVNFPVPKHLVFNDLSVDLWDDSDDDESYTNKHNIYAHTVSWLEKSGYIWLINPDEYEAHEVVLTPKGLELLKMPSSMEVPGESFGDQIREALGKGAKNAAANLISKALTVGVTIVTS